MGVWAPSARRSTRRRSPRRRSWPTRRNMPRVSSNRSARPRSRRRSSVIVARTRWIPPTPRRRCARSPSIWTRAPTSSWPTSRGRRRGCSSAGSDDAEAPAVRISAKGEYAIRAMLDLALQRERGLIPIQEIAVRQSIPQRYLEQVLLALKRAGLLTSKRGSTGGYHLGRDPEDITVGAVLRAVEGTRSTFQANASPDLADLWLEVSEAVSKVVDRVTFGELVARASERRGRTRPMYHI